MQVAINVSIDGNEVNIRECNIGQLAHIISRNWGDKVNAFAKPYLNAMYSMDDIRDNYACDSGISIATYFLVNSIGWRGDVARTVKAELKRRLKNSH